MKINSGALKSDTFLQRADFLSSNPIEGQCRPPLISIPQPKMADKIQQWLAFIILRYILIAEPQTAPEHNGDLYLEFPTVHHVMYYHSELLLFRISSSQFQGGFSCHGMGELLTWEKKVPDGKGVSIVKKGLLNGSGGLLM